MIAHEHANIHQYCAQTVAEIRKCDDDEHTSNDPKMRRQIKVHVIMHYFVPSCCLCLVAMIERCGSEMLWLVRCKATCAQANSFE